MDKDAKIRELELEIARLNGVIEGMQRMKPVNNPPYLAPYTQPTTPWPNRPFDIWCGSRVGYATTKCDSTALIQN